MFPRDYAVVGQEGWAVHAVKTWEDGFPVLLLRIVFDDERQRDAYIRENLRDDDELLDDIPNLPDV